MNHPQEPRDGDFVAYIERLQRESAARLSRQSAPVPIDTSPHAATTPVARKSAAEQFANSAATELSKVQVEQLMTRLSASRPVARAIGGVIALIVGVFLFLIWLVADRSGLWVVIAVALTLWGFSRLRAALAELSSTDRRLGQELAVRWLGPTRRR